MKPKLLLLGILFSLLNVIITENLYAQPSNDECVNAIDISSAFSGLCGDVTVNGPYTLTGSTAGVDDPPEPGEAGVCVGETDTGLFGDDAEEWENSVWFSWVVPDLNGDGSAVTYSIFTSDGSFGDNCGIVNPLSGDFDTQAAIYQGACPTATTGECDHYGASEDIFNKPPFISGWEDIQFIPGTTYYMGIDGWDATHGEFCITVTVCGEECGDGVCDPLETYCSCIDCEFNEDGLRDCPFGAVTTLYYEDGYFWNFSNNLNENIYLCSEFINGFSGENIYLAFGVREFIDCSGTSSTFKDIDISLSIGKLLSDAAITDNGDGTFSIKTNFRYNIELSPADIATGSITITSMISDGVGNTCNQVFNINFADTPQINNPYCVLPCLAGGVDTDLLENDLMVCEGQSFTLSTNGLEDLSLPCNSGDGSSFVYAWRLLLDIYANGDFAAVANWQPLGTNPTIDPLTFFIDEFGYVPPLYTVGTPIDPIDLYTGLPRTFKIQAAAICFGTDGGMVEVCAAKNENYESSLIKGIYSDCVGEPACPTDIVIESNNSGATLQNSYSSSQTIQTETGIQNGISVVIRNNETVNLNSNKITLNSGFAVLNGGCLNVEINPCE